MRSLGDGFVAYTYSSRAAAIQEDPRQPVWVAPNSLYRRDSLTNIEIGAPRSTVIYVGRFEPAKKVDMCIRGFAEFIRCGGDARLVLVGGGSLEPQMRHLARSLGIEDLVDFAGWVNGVDELRSLYSHAFCSLSPGFVGLGLTQSLGFGVPMVASRDEPHSPEVELANTGALSWFRTDDPEDLAAVIMARFRDRERLPLVDVMNHVRRNYSAESMAAGIAAAMMGESEEASEN